MKFAKPNSKNSNPKATTRPSSVLDAKDFLLHPNPSNKLYFFILLQPGPGSYQIDKRRSKKTKYIKVRKDFYESQPIKKEDLEMSNPLGFMKRPMENKPNYSYV
jgi:hypothetical protein